VDLLEAATVGLLENIQNVAGNTGVDDPGARGEVGPFFSRLSIGRYPRLSYEWR
jgi:hypothetical protein